MTTPYTDPDAGKTPQQLLAERTKRLQDARAMKQPDRIPITLRLGYLLAELGGVTKQELHDNPEKAQEILEEAALYFQADSVSGLFGSPAVSKILGDRMTKWPGHGLGPDGSFQFNEQEFMKAEDYDAFLEDPSDWAIRTYLPRAFSALEGLSQMPPLGMFSFGYYHTWNFARFAAPPIAAALDAFNEAVQTAAAAVPEMIARSQRMADLGFATDLSLAALIEAPFDFMSDTLRGMRGIFLDMLRRPEKLLAAQEKVSRFQLEFAISTASALNARDVAIPLHRGSDGFMSLPQFEKFYWPQLKQMMLDLVATGLTPIPFYEGVWDQRLKYLAELPKGKTVGMFQNSDIFQVKQVLGDVMPILGGMPVSMLQGGTVEQIRAHTKKLCEIVGEGGGFIMSANIGEMEGCKPELIKTWVNATKEYGVY